MAEIKTKVRRISVETFLRGIRDEKKREECHQVLKIMKRATGSEPKMWGPSIVGFDQYHYKYESGREGGGASGSADAAEPPGCWSFSISRCSHSV